MTREEQDKAIRILQWLHDNYFLFRSTEEDVKYATKLAIQELQKEPCEDAISRHAAIDAIENEQKKIMRSDWAIDQAKFSAMSEIRALIADLPSVSTEKTERESEDAVSREKNISKGFEDFMIKVLREQKQAESEDTE